MTYQLLQVAFLRYLAEVTGDLQLRDMGQRWQTSAENPGKRLSALYWKIRYRLAKRW